MKLLANLGLALLFVLALAAVGTAAVWKYAPQYVKIVDDKWVGHHTGKVRRTIVALREESKTDPDAAVRGLQELRESLEGYEKADRRYPLRRQALRLLADIHFDQKDLAGAEQVGVELVGLDKNDVGTRLWFGRRLCGHKPTLEHGLKVLGSLFEMLPESGVVARAYVECLSAADQPERSAAALVKHANRMLRPEQSLEGVSGGWQLWWSSDGSFAKERRVDIQALRYGDITALAFELPEKATTLRLDPPRGSRLAYSNPRLGLVVGGGQVEVPIPEEDLKLSDMYLGKDALYTVGGPDPWATIPLPAEHQGEPLRGRFVFKADRLPLWIGEAAGSPAVRGLITEAGPDSDLGKMLDGAHAQYLEVTAKSGLEPR